MMPILLVSLLSISAGASPRLPKSVVVSDFEDGLQGWWTLDAVQHARKSGPSVLLSVAHTAEAHSGRGALEIQFFPGTGWANAHVPAAEIGERAARIGADELRLWFRGDGSSKEVRIALQSWAEDLVTPVHFEIPVSLANREWHELRLPLERFAAATPDRTLSLRALISVQVNGRGEIGPARCWVDDIRFVNARGQGARFAVDFLGKKLAGRPPASRIPRLGNWSWPGDDPSKVAPCRALGIQFSSNATSPLRERQLFLEGFATNYAPGRPSGADLIAGLGLTDADIDQDADGNRSSEGVESTCFHPAAIDRFVRWTAAKVVTRADAPWVCGIMLSSPVSMYGEVHYPPSTTGQFLVFGRAARDNFRAWVRRAYRDDLSALRRAWGRPIESWDAVNPPRGPEVGTVGLDTRQEWSDFQHWYHGWLEEVTERCLKAARRETAKPLATMCGGPKVGINQGICSGNIGPLVRMLGRVRPAFFNDTDSQTLFSARYTAAACHQYGVQQMLEHVGPPHLNRFHQVNMVTNVLATGAPIAHLAHLGELFDENHWFCRMWRDFAPVILRYQTEYVPSEAAFFHSYVTARYRWERGNSDCVALYDSTNQLWFPDRGYPSWGRALGTPDVVDDAMIEDGALRGRKLLVIPNGSVTVTTRKAVEAIRRWVRGGGTLIGFGSGCLAWTVEPDRSLRATPNLAGMARAGTTETPLGRGRVVWYPTAADPARNPEFCRQMMDDLEREAARAGVRRWCRTDPRIHVMYAGRDATTRRLIFVGHFLRSARNGEERVDYWTDTAFDVTFDPSLRGEAELVGIATTFERCEGGEATHDPRSGVLSVRFTLPGRLRLVFGRPR